MVQFKWNDTMKRHDVKVPYSLAGEKGMKTIAYIDGDKNPKITVYGEIPIELLKQVVLSWDEYNHMLSREARELDELLTDKKKGDSNGI